MIRRLLDVAFALICLIWTAPAMVVIAVLIKLDSKGPVLYTPSTVGQGGRVFRLLRFRTMFVDKTQGFTPVGRFIRNYSLDHLPMLLNVLKGDLSIVGPRPMESEVVNLQDPAWQKYVSVKPGVFCFAVLKLGKTYGHSSAPNLCLKRDLELAYIEQRSAAHDWRLFWQSIRAHIASRGNVKARGEPDLQMVSRLEESSNVDEH